MSPTPRGNREPVVESAAERHDFRDNFATLFLRGMERVAEIQKQAIDLAVQQNAEMFDVLKKVAEKVPGAPSMPMFDLATGAVSRYADTQKSAIDFAVEQSEVWTGVFKDRAGSAKTSTESTANIAKQTMERSFAVQKKALQNTAAQAREVVDAAKHQFGLSGTQANAMTDSFQRGVDSIVEAQKELLDLVTH